jgi:DNA-binding NtrC family response regulator
MVLSGGKEIDLRHLPPAMVDSRTPVESRVAPGDANGLVPLQVALHKFEQEYLQRALKAAKNKRTKAASLLGISRKTLWEKLRSSELTFSDSPREADELSDDDRDQGPRSSEASSRTSDGVPR